MIESQPISTDTGKPLTEAKSDFLPTPSLEEIVSEINSGIPQEVKILNRDELIQKHRELGKLPYLSHEVFWELLDSKGQDLGVNMVDTKDIVGSISPAFENWSTEYDYRKGRAVDIAEQLINPTLESVDKVFHITQPKLEQGIKLRQLSTPEGNLFFVIDGSHRVAGCKLAEVKRIPAFVEKIPEIKEISTNSNILKRDWEERIKRGLIVGNIEEVTNEDEGKSFVLKIESQVLPWMFLPNHQIVKLNKFYFEHFPDVRSLRSYVNGESIPKEALIDGTAFSYYLTNKWEEYISRGDKK